MKIYHFCCLHTKTQIKHHTFCEQNTPKMMDFIVNSNKIYANCQIERTLPKKTQSVATVFFAGSISLSRALFPCLSLFGNSFFANLTRNARAGSLGLGTMTTTDPNIVGVGRVARVARCVPGNLLKNFDFWRPQKPVLAAAASNWWQCKLLTDHIFLTKREQNQCPIHKS